MDFESVNIFQEWNVIYLDKNSFTKFQGLPASKKSFLSYIDRGNEMHINGSGVFISSK